MISKILKTQQLVPESLQLSFEKALEAIPAAKRAAKVSERKMPIAQRPLGKRESAAGAEKRALSDAAKALSALWKLAPNSER